MKTTYIFLICLAPWCMAGQVRDSLEVAWEVDSLLKTATELAEAEKFQKALPLAQQAANVSKQAWGETNVRYAAALHEQAGIYFKLDQFDQAEEIYWKAIDLRAKLLGQEHVDVASSLSKLSTVYLEKDNLAKAESLILEAIEILAGTVGKEHPEYAKALYIRARLYDYTGDLAKMELTLLQIKAIQEKTVSKEHPDYAQTLNGLGSVNLQIGKDVQAESLYLEVLSIHAKTSGKNNPSYAKWLFHLALLYQYGQFDDTKAEPLYLESLEILAGTVGKEHSQNIRPLMALADIYYNKGDYANAERLLSEAKEIIERVYGQEAVRYGLCLAKLARVYHAKGEHAKEVPLYLQCKEIQEKTVGKENQNARWVLEVLAIAYQETDRFPEAAALFIEVNECERHLSEKTAAYFSENQMLTYLNTPDQIQLMGELQSLAQFYPSPELSRASFDNALFYNGFLLENARRLARSVAGADSITRDIYRRWQACRRRLAEEYTRSVAEHRSVAAAEAEAEVYEKTLTRSLPAFGKLRRAPNWQDVRDQLRPGEAAVEFIHYDYYTPSPTDSTMYAALVLRPGDAHPHLVPLFEYRQIISLLRKTNSRDQDLIDRLYTFQPGQASLYFLIWQPLDSLLQGVNTIYCAPSGVLHRLNLGAISFSSSQTFADRYHLVTLGSTRQLVTRTAGPPAATPDAILFGGVEYDLDSTAVVTTQWSDGTRGTEGATLAFDLPFLRDTLRGGQKPWPHLPNTQTEVDNIDVLLHTQGYKTQKRSGTDASEEAFKQLGQIASSPRILHLATHGYFFPDPADSAPKTNGGSQKSAFQTSEQPMIRSGLILAGANRVWLGGKPLPGREDGILTAYEISQMNLENTELVVLSACETGLGAIEGNEGVYGLQRAFKIAGAHYLIMSLWSVSDRKTAELMQAFFQNYLERGLPVPEAFRAAQQAMRAKYPKTPSAWAGFVLVE